MLMLKYVTINLRSSLDHINTRGRIWRCMYFIRCCHCMIVASHSASPLLTIVECFKCLLSYFLIWWIGMDHKKFNLKVTWQKMSKLELWSLLASRCVTVGVVGRRRVMHSVALTANAPLELPELKQQRCWLPVNDHRSSSPPDVNALFVSRIKDRNPATAIVSLMSTPGRCRLNLVLASQTSPHLRKAELMLKPRLPVLPAVPWIVQDLETSRTTWEVGKECCPTTLLALTNCTKNEVSGARMLIICIYMIVKKPAFAFKAVNLIRC